MVTRPTTPIERDPARLEDALPWYRNGTLSGDDRAWVEAQLAAGDDPARIAARAAAEFDAKIEAEFEAQIAELPADLGWERLLARTRADAAGAGTARGFAGTAGLAGMAGRGGTARQGGAAGQGGTDSMWQQLSSWFAGLLSPQLGMAMAALLVVQAVAIGWLATDGEGTGDTVEYRSGAGAQPVESIRALLNAGTTEQALRDALLANRAIIIDGPNDLGEYWILAPDRPAEPVAAALRDAGVIATYAIDHRPRVR
ncbi:MAG: hypothetical protein AB7G13_25490 [Lautropia sp.]